MFHGLTLKNRKGFSIRNHFTQLDFEQVGEVINVEVTNFNNFQIPETVSLVSISRSDWEDIVEAMK